MTENKVCQTDSSPKDSRVLLSILYLLMLWPPTLNFPCSDAKEAEGKAEKIPLYFQKGFWLFFLMQNRLEVSYAMNRNKPYDSQSCSKVLKLIASDMFRWG